jgi:hypothetical protein
MGAIDMAFDLGRNGGQDRSVAIRGRTRLGVCLGAPQLAEDEKGGCANEK